MSTLQHPEQRQQLATLSYQNKIERRELKSDKADKTDKKGEANDSLSSTQVIPHLVSVIGLVKEKKTQKSPGKPVVKEKCKKKHSTPSKPAKSSTNSKLKTVDQKWSEHFRRLEALLVSRSLGEVRSTIDPPDC